MKSESYEHLHGCVGIFPVGSVKMNPESLFLEPWGFSVKTEIDKLCAGKGVSLGKGQQKCTMAFLQIVKVDTDWSLFSNSKQVWIERLCGIADYKNGMARRF